MGKRLISITALPLAGVAIAAVAYLYFRGPSMVPPSPVTVKITPERLARGKHLYENVAFCNGCHSLRDYSQPGAPILVPGQGQILPKDARLPGRIVASNITPDKETGIGQWSDGEKIRAIRDGVSRDGHALFPTMPYKQYRLMSDEDVYSLVAYVNTLPAVFNCLPQTEIEFPANLWINSGPQPAGMVAEPDRKNAFKYGEYLVTIAGCLSCHGSEENRKSTLRLAGRKVSRLWHDSGNLSADELAAMNTYLKTQPATLR